MAEQYSCMYTMGFGYTFVYTHVMRVPVCAVHSVSCVCMLIADIIAH